MDALDDTFIFTDFMKEHGVPYTDRDGVYAVSSMQQLAEVEAGAQPGRSVRSGRRRCVGSGTMTIPMSSRPFSSGPGRRCCPELMLRGTTSIGRRLHHRPEQLSGKRKGRRKHKSQRLAGLRFRRSAPTRPSAPSPMSVRVRVSGRMCAAAISWRSRTPPSATARKSPI